MVRGEAGTAVKLGVKGDGGVREIAITRIASEKLYKGRDGITWWVGAIDTDLNKSEADRLWQ